MKIIKIKKVGNRYKIVFDDSELITYENVLIKFNLLYKKEIDNELYEEIVKYNDYYALYNKTLDLLNKKMKCTIEIYNYLIKYTDNTDYIDKIIKDLTDKNIINDSLFAKAYISDKLYLSDYGPNKIKKDLINLNISEELLDELLSNIDYEFIYNKLNRIIDKKIQNNKYSVNYLKNKLISHLYMSGYNKDMIIDILNKKTINSNIENDYRKIAKKYSNKFKEYELDKLIKSKLYSKGYSLEEINNIKKTN